MFVYDYVIYNGEPIIEFRLKYLNNYVDKFIIVESIYTHSGNKKTNFILISIKIYLNLIEKKYYFSLFTIYQLKPMLYIYDKIIFYMKIQTHGLMKYINEIIFKIY